MYFVFTFDFQLFSEHLFSVLMSILKKTEEHKNKKLKNDGVGCKKICPLVLLSEIRKHPQKQREKNVEKALVRLEDYP